MSRASRAFRPPSEKKGDKNKANSLEKKGTKRS